MRSRARFKPPAVEWAIVLLLIAIVAVVTVSVFVVSFDQLSANLRKLDGVTVAACFLGMAWQSGGRCLRWLVYVRNLGLKLPLREAALYYAAAFSMTLTPARLGETLRLWFLEKRFGVYYRRIVGLYIADRLSDAIAYLILLVVGSIAYAQSSPAAWGIRLAIMACIAALMYPKPIFAVLRVAYAVTRRGRKAVVWLRRAVRNTSTLFQPKVFIPGVAIGTVGWLATPAVLTLILAQMGITIDPLQVAAIYATAALAGGSSMVPGGVGVTEAVLVVLLTASDVPLDIAVAAMMVTRLTFLWLPAGLGLLLLPVAIRTAGVKAKAV